MGQTYNLAQLQSKEKARSSTILYSSSHASGRERDKCKAHLTEEQEGLRQEERPIGYRG